LEYYGYANITVIYQLMQSRQCD